MRRWLVAVSFLPLAACDGGSSGQDVDAIVADSRRALAEVEERYPTEDRGFKWEYETASDPMTDRTTRTACITSSNAVQLPSPYEATRAQLCLRDHPQHGRDAYVHLLKDGQILCRSYEDCVVQVRFDKDSVRPYNAIGASDGSSNIFFVRNRDRLERGLKTADVTAIQAEFYQAGNQAMMFDTKGFAWPKPK